MTTGTLKLDVPYFLSLLVKMLTASLHSSCVNLVQFICFCRTISIRCCIVLAIVCITQLGCSSSLSLACFVSSSSSPSPSSPSSQLGMLLRLSPIARLIWYIVFFGSLVSQSCHFSSLCIFLLLSKHCHCFFNSHACHSGFSLNKTHNPFVLHFIIWEVCFSLFFSWMHLFGSHAVQGPQGSDSFCIQVAVAFNCLMTGWSGSLCWFTIFACRMCRKVYFWSNNYCHLC